MFFVCLVLNEVFLIVCCNTPKPNQQAINMKQKKNFLMSPLNSNKLKKFSLYNKSKQCCNHSSQMFSFLFFFFQSMYCLFKKNVRSFFLFFSYAVFNNVQVSLLFLSFFFSVPFSLSCSFFLFVFFLSSFSFFFLHNKLLIQCPFFSTLYLPLSVFTLTQ